MIRAFVLVLFAGVITSSIVLGRTNPRYHQGRVFTQCNRLSINRTIRCACVSIIESDQVQTTSAMEERCAPFLVARTGARCHSFRILLRKISFIREFCLPMSGMGTTSVSVSARQLTKEKIAKILDEIEDMISQILNAGYIHGPSVAPGLRFLKLRDESAMRKKVRMELYNGFLP